MDRRNFVGGLMTLGAGTFAVGMQSIGERVNDLEERVDDLDQRVTALESASGADDSAPDASRTAAPSGTESPTVSGSGTSVSDIFHLEPGRYRVDAHVEVTAGFTGFSVWLHAPNGDRELMFNEIIDQSGIWEGSSIYQAASSGEYFFEVENTDASWTLSCTPM